MYFFGAEETKATDKALASRQTCLAGDQIQPRDENSKMDSGLADHRLCRTAGCRLQCTSRSTATKTQGGPGTGKSECERGMSQHSQTTRGQAGPSPSWLGPASPWRGQCLPASSPRQPVSFLLCLQPSRSKVSRHRVHQTWPAVTSHVRHTVGSVRI